MSFIYVVDLARPYFKISPIIRLPQVCHFSIEHGLLLPSDLCGNKIGFTKQAFVNTINNIYGVLSMNAISISKLHHCSFVLAKIFVTTNLIYKFLFWNVGIIFFICFYLRKGKFYCFIQQKL